ncbi:hypothetical protein DFH07DRAFT_851410 [Mycena maculata]|uniref:Uncharacterized protein n=1 Tax=Mycena maculata TaxID=230809 RepID=A0AAD7MQU8_9AGAR|nr:hypothetical protein DFH07DRAFT_851410 [Mycena maculata]
MEVFLVAQLLLVVRLSVVVRVLGFLRNFFVGRALFGRFFVVGRGFIVSGRYPVLAHTQYGLTIRNMRATSLACAYGKQPSTS